MKIAIRIDDITADMNWDNFYAFKSILDQYHIKPLIGVVPNCKDENLCMQEAKADFWDCIRQVEREGWTIALHGYEHLYTTKKSGSFPLNNFSEFAGVPYEKQGEMIRYGGQVFQEQGIHTDIFMPPGHTFDHNTVKVLLENGYTTITDGFGKMPYYKNGMKYLPISFLQSRSLKETNGYTTFVYHLNGMSLEAINQFGNMVKEHENRFLSYDQYVKAPAKKQGIIGICTEYSMAKAKFLIGKMRS